MNLSQCQANLMKELQNAISKLDSSLIFSFKNSLNWVITFHEFTCTNNYHMYSLYTIIYTCMLKLYIFYHTVSKLNIGKEII